MTLIVSAISDFGVVQASDSNIVQSLPVAATTDGEKVFGLPFAPAAIAVAGTYRVGILRMDEWMPSAIADFQVGTSVNPVGAFAEYLATRLENELTERQWGEPTVLQIVGYEGDAKNSQHPVLYHLRNVDRIDPNTGNYVGISNKFQVTEDFWLRDHDPVRSPGAHNQFRVQFYFNGSTAGRTVFGRHLIEMFGIIWSDASNEFRSPRNLYELTEFMKILIQTIGTLYSISDYVMRPVGGPPQMWAIPQPNGAVELWAEAKAT
ncbi:MAG: hypothetical protein Q7L55_05075 [Actinomycetota bacterium]|nr:hypothetical protein [Actinomycetota bacterium]